MGGNKIRQCQCKDCLQGDHPDKRFHYQINLLISQLNERQGRLFIALEAQKIGHGGIKLLSEITGMDRKTIRRGIQELLQEDNEETDRIRSKGGGRKLVEKKESLDRN